ncbi:hypothetical protein [Tolypothrix bouteillei]|uniref:Uncharacterized protein n=1 Tax=Tolypothrix bouteillei VB521301 TaxID=1479485 RepID=A0A8S9SXQ2_9CYAN|nr:hypothetical protein [Tolypothrix bouteillei]KAF3884164.1 hypothetical protein DA73_0400000610 [Tolypothrix bouteillei VB521301]
MNPALNKLEVTSLISKYLRTCPYLFECVGLYGSVVKNNSYRDIDILFIVSNSDDIESLKEWVKKWLEPLFTVPLDAKYYSIESFSNLIENNSPLVLSIAVEIEFIIPHLQIEKKLVGLKDVLFNKGIDTSQHYRLIISQEILSKILYEENKSLRGFLISHVDWIKNDNQEIRELLRVLAPIDEPYTRIACLKQAIKLLHSNQYRQHLNFSIGESINLATQIVLNRKNFNWNTHEDYSNKDLCLELVSLVEKFPPSLWSKAEGLLSALTQDFNHYVRYSMIKFIYNKILPSDSEMGFDLLTVAFKSERKIWIVSEISLTYFVNQTVIDKERLKLIIEGYNKKNNKLKLSTRITNFLELLNQPFENNNLTIPFLVVFLKNYRIFMMKHKKLMN